MSDYVAKSVSIASYGRYVATTSGDSVLLLDKGGRIKWEYETRGPVNGVAISPDGNYIAAGSSDYNLYFFSTILKGDIYVETYANNTSTGNTTPVNASVYLDGKHKGETPLTISDIWAGTYTVNVTEPGYDDISREVKVEKDRTAKLLLELNPKPTATPTAEETPVGGLTATPIPTETGDGGLFGMPGFTAISMITGIIIATLLLKRKRG
jgi:WD40 repeat protein